MNEKPYGWEIDVLVCDRMVKVEANSTVVTKRYRGGQSQARQRGMMLSHAWAIKAVRGLTEAQWISAYGQPWEKGL